MFDHLRRLIAQKSPSKQRPQSSTCTHPPPTNLSLQHAQTLNAFALNLFAQLAATSQDVILSPLSLSAALTLTAAGATPSSETASQFETLLPKPSSSSPITSTSFTSPHITLSVATSAWLDTSIRPQFVAKAKELHADVQPLPKDVAVVNRWVSERTQGNIDNVLSSIPSDVVAFIVNAVYFRAAWTVPFDPDLTINAPFHAEREGDATDDAAAAGTTREKTVRLMRRTNAHTLYAQYPLSSAQDTLADASVKVIELPYGKEETHSAILILPQGTTTLTTVITHLSQNPAQLTSWLDAKTLRETKLDVLAIPRFSLHRPPSSVKSALQAIGLKAPFVQNVESPPFEGMSQDGRVHIGDVLHTVDVKVTEEGTVASAATVVQLQTRSMVLDAPTFVADRPFLFAVREKDSGVLLFVARVDAPVNP